MAVGDFTITDGTRVSLGNATMISGTIEAGTTGAQADIFPNGYIQSFSINGNRDGFATAIPLVLTNASAADGTADNGSVWIDTNVAGPETFDWTSVFVETNNL